MFEYADNKTKTKSRRDIIYNLSSEYQYELSITRFFVSFINYYYYFVSVTILMPERNDGVFCKNNLKCRLGCNLYNRKTRFNYQML